VTGLKTCNICRPKKRAKGAKEREVHKEEIATRIANQQVAEEPVKKGIRTGVVEENQRLRVENQELKSAMAELRKENEKLEEKDQQWGHLIQSSMALVQQARCSSHHHS
jgi:regulator of replication initiation timing